MNLLRVRRLFRFFAVSQRPLRKEGGQAGAKEGISSGVPRTHSGTACTIGRLDFPPFLASSVPGFLMGPLKTAKKRSGRRARRRAVCSRLYPKTASGGGHGLSRRASRALRHRDTVCRFPDKPWHRLFGRSLIPCTFATSRFFAPSRFTEGFTRVRVFQRPLVCLYPCSSVFIRGYSTLS